MIKNLKFENLSQRSSVFFSDRFRVIDAAFSPLKLFISIAGLLVVLGIGVALFPAFFGAIFGAFLVAFGAVFGMLAWKLYCFKKKFDQFFANIPKTVVIQRPLSDIEDEMANIQEELKKVTWH